MEHWDELERFCQEWPGPPPAEDQDSVDQQLRALAELLDRHEADLQIREALDQIRGSALRGSGELLERRGPFDLARSFALAWLAGSDPRPDRAAQSGEYHIEAWLGFHPQTGRACVRVTGEKVLEAYLPVTAEKLRTALLRALQAPRALLLPTTPDEATTEPDETAASSDSPPSAATEPPAPSTPDTQPHGSAID